MINHRPKHLLAHKVDLTAEDMEILHAAHTMLYRLFNMVENTDNQRKINNLHDEIEELIDYLSDSANTFAHDDPKIVGMIVEFIEDDGRFKED